MSDNKTVVERYATLDRIGTLLKQLNVELAALQEEKEDLYFETVRLREKNND